LQSVHEIVFQRRVDGLRILFGLKFRLVDSDQFLSFAGFLTKTVIGNAIKPGGKLRFSSKAPNVFVGAQESFLSEIIRQSNVGSRKLSEQAADRGLMIADQLGKGVVIIIDQNPRDQIGIIEWHPGSLHLGGRLLFAHV